MIARILCWFAHDYMALPHVPGRYYMMGHGPQKCRRCGAEHQGLIIPPAPPDFLERYARAATAKQRQHIRGVLQRARQSADARRA